MFLVEHRHFIPDRHVLHRPEPFELPVCLPLFGRHPFGFVPFMLKELHLQPFDLGFQPLRGGGSSRMTMMSCGCLSGGMAIR